jgi:hypothetical protein
VDGSWPVNGDVFLRARRCFAVAALHHSISIHAMHIGMNGFNLLFINHQAV